MTEAETLLDYMEYHRDEFLKVLKEAVIIETPTEGDKKDLEQCRMYFANLFADIGFQCRVVPSNDNRYGDHLLMELGDGEEQLLFVGHYDTVYPKSGFGELWRQEGAKVWGPGALDMKGGVVQVYMVIKALRELTLLPSNKKIVFFLSADEESGSYSSHMHYEKLAKNSKAAFVMEPPAGDDVGGLWTGHFGRGNYTFVAEGKSAHSGLEPENAESALKELAQQVVFLESLTNLQKGVTVACTCLKSGNAGWPTVPGDGELTIDARFSTAETAAEYDKLFTNLEPFNPEIKITTKGGIEKPVFDEEHPKHRALYEKSIEVGEKLGIEMNGVMVRAGTDGNFTAAAECPTLSGMGITGNFLHQPGKEYINTDQFAIRSSFVALMVLAVLED